MDDYLTSSFSHACRQTAYKWICFSYLSEQINLWHILIYKRGLKGGGAAAKHSQYMLIQIQSWMYLVLNCVCVQGSLVKFVMDAWDSRGRETSQ